MRSMRGLPRAQFPEIVPPQVIVTTTYPGADAITMEQAVATPIEQQMNGVDNMIYMDSVSANNGETVMLGGLITKETSTDDRKVPLLADIPILGNLFRYKSSSVERTELLIILTPKIVYNKLDSDVQKQIESSRMSWCLSDVVKLHGDADHPEEIVLSERSLQLMGLACVVLVGLGIYAR